MAIDDRRQCLGPQDLELFFRLVRVRVIATYIDLAVGLCQLVRIAHNL